MIDEKVLIERLEAEKSTTWNCGYKNGIDGAIKIVNQLAEESAKDTNVLTNNGWIPCSERLPEQWQSIYISGELVDGMGGVSYKAVFGENEHQDCFYGYYFAGDFFGITEEGIYWLVDAVAWQPLPAPYVDKETK